MNRRAVVVSCALAAGMWTLGSSSAAPLPKPFQEGTAPEVAPATNLVLGELPPTDFSLISIDGQTYDSATMRGDGPLLLVFFRGAW